jgi:hypothetical protein
MTRYFFHIRDGENLSKTGRVLSSARWTTHAPKRNAPVTYLSTTSSKAKRWTLDVSKCGTKWACPASFYPSSKRLVSNDTPRTLG